jgi:hypothetical protein
MKQGQEISTLVRTLLSAGFRIKDTHHKPSYIALSAGRTDEFGVENRYLFACVAAHRELSDDDVGSLKKVAQHEGLALVIVGRVSATATDVAVLSDNELLGRLGGPILALLPLEPEFPERLRILGHNELPAGVAGKPDTVFEEYVHAGLQFVLQDRVVRYGQDRLFEALPDGLVAGHRSPLMLYDAKASKDGYEINSTTIRQFADYVRTFHSRYEGFTGRLYAFLLISGHFQVEGNLEERSAQLYAECSVPLRTCTADEMAKIVALLADRPSYRQAIDWKTIFSKTVITAQVVEDNLAARLRDGAIHS